MNKKILLNHLTVVLLTISLINCDNKTKEKDSCSKKQIPLYITNSSFFDTLAYTEIAIDDSVYIANNMAQYKIGGEKYYKTIPLCKGSHRVTALFGRYKKDTIISIRGAQSLYVSMDHANYPHAINNGITIVVLDSAYTSKAID